MSKSEDDVSGEGEATPTSQEIEKAASDRLQKLARQAADVAETLPDLYKLKCFEILLPYFLSQGGMSFPPTPQALPIPPITQNPIIRLEVKALLRQYSVPESIVLENFFVDGQVVPIYTLNSTKTKKSRVQIMIALLTAMENALKTGSFQFTMDQVKLKCQKDGKYDAVNFKANFKNAKKFFTVVSETEPMELNSDGKSELADVLLELKK